MGKDLQGNEIGKGLCQRKNGTYCARFFNRFHKRITLYDKNLNQLKESFIKAKEADKLRIPTPLHNTNLTLDNWFIDWIEIHKYQAIRASTLQTYKQVYYKHISPTIGQCKLHQITNLQIKFLINQLYKAGYKYTTLNRVKIILQDIFEKALIDDLVTKNPTRGIKIRRDEYKEPRFLTQEEQSTFFEYSRGTFYDNLFTVALLSGLRLGELTALTESDIDFTNKTIHITKTLSYQKFEHDEKKTYHLDPPKTRYSKRQIPMTQGCETALKRQIKQRNIIIHKQSANPIVDFEDLLFTTQRATPINAVTINNAIKEIIRNINICRSSLDQIEPFSSHCFRHTFASNCYSSGIDIKTIQRYLGHSSIQMTMNLYLHLFEEVTNDQIDKMDTLVSPLFSDPIVSEIIPIIPNHNSL